MINDYPQNIIDALRGELQKNATQEEIIHLITVGGYPNQDLPMSGELQPTPTLQTFPYLAIFLQGFIPPVGRVCLYRKNYSYPLYTNAAHFLFYQPILIPIDGDYSLLIEIYHPPSECELEKIWSPSYNKALNLVPPRLDILPPAEFRKYLFLCIAGAPINQQENVYSLCEELSARWEAHYSECGGNYSGEWSYQAVLNALQNRLIPLINPVISTLADPEKSQLEKGLAILTTQFHVFPPSPRRIDRKLLSRPRTFRIAENIPEFYRPLFIVSAPRAGSTLLFETLAQFRKIWTTGGENHNLLEDISGLHPQDHDFRSNCLDASDANPRVRDALLRAFTARLQGRDFHFYLDNSPAPKQIRFLEKTPKNALRIPFFKSLFPDALFIYLQRDHIGNISSMIDGWRSQRFISYRTLPGFPDYHWSFLLVPGWESLLGSSIARISAYQWSITNQIIQNNLQMLSSDDWIAIEYQDLIDHPMETVERIARFAGLAWDAVIQTRCTTTLPVSRLTLTSPNQDKWRKHRHFFSEII